MKKLQQYVVRQSGLLSWLIALSISIVLVTMDQIENLNEALCGALWVIYGLRAAFRFFGLMSDVHDDGSFSGMLKFGGRTVTSFMRSLTVMSRPTLMMVVYAVVGNSVGFDGMKWFLIVSLLISAIPWRKSGKVAT